MEIKLLTSTSSRARGGGVASGSTVGARSGAKMPLSTGKGARSGYSSKQWQAKSPVATTAPRSGPSQAVGANTLAVPAPSG